MNEEKVNENVAESPAAPAATAAAPAPVAAAPVPAESDVMNKDELIAAIHGILKGQVAKKDIAEIYDATVAAVSQGLVEGKRVRIAGLGTFHTKKIDERAGRNPRTQDVVKIPTHREIRFRPADDLKRKVFPVS